MQKKSLKITLNRETLRALEPSKLKELQGAFFTESCIIIFTICIC